MCGTRRPIGDHLVTTDTLKISTVLQASLMLSFQDKMMKDCFAGIDHFLGRCVSVNTLQRADPKSLWSEPPGWFRIHQESSVQDMPGCTWWWPIKQNIVFYSVLWRSCSDILLPNCPTWGDRSQGWRGTSRSSCAPPHVPAPGSRDQTWLPGSSLPVQNRLKRQIKAHSEETPTIMGWPKVHKEYFDQNVKTFSL